MQPFLLPLALIQIANDAVPLLAIGLGGLVLLIPIVGLTARLAVKPLLDAWTASRTVPVAEERPRLMEQRIALLEHQVESVERQNEQLIEGRDCQRKLHGPG